MNTTMLSDDTQEEDFNINETVEKYLVYWTWFALGVFLCLSIAYVYLRYTTPQYQAKTTILVKDEKKGGMLSELSAFSDLGLGGMKSNVDNEVEILRSMTLAESTVKRLELNISIIEKGRISSVDIYNNAPIEVHFKNQKPNFYQESFQFEFVQKTPHTFELIFENEFENEKDDDNFTPVIVSQKKEFRYGELIPTRCGDLMITKPLKANVPKINHEKTIFIIVSPLDAVVGSYLSRIEVSSISKTSSVVEITFKDPNAKRAETFLNTMIQIYNEAAAADKNFISENTSKFIANRLVLITEELDGVEKDVENFKQSNGLTDIESEAKLFIEGTSEYNKLVVQNEIQLNVVASMLDFLKTSTNSDLLPSNLIVGQEDASQLINSYNQLVLERNRILKSATLSNPAIVQLDQQIVSLKSNVKASLIRFQSNLNIQKSNLKGQEGIFESKIGKIPVQERLFRVIARQQKVKEELYLYLLQKREETAISLAATAPNARVIDLAKALKNPVSPKKNIIYLAALFLGLLIPFGILYFKELFDTKVKKRTDITEKLNIPFLGDVPKSLNPKDIINTTNRTSSAEAIRIVRANLDYMLTQVPDGSAKTIFVTSTIPGEGKTFLSINLSSIFAHSGKKILLIGMDIRKPKLNEYVVTKDGKGLTDYLSSKNAPISDFIITMKGYEAFDILLGGNIPPNPTEMLMSNKVGELFTQFKKQYDYIIVDTPPISLVSDTLILSKHADTFIYVVRANYLDKRMLHFPEILYKENKLPNMAIILNDTNINKGYGGYGYGSYGYGDFETTKKTWYSRFLNKSKLG